MSWALLSYAFAVGMAATVNPCGAALLPVYLTWFTRSERSPSPAVRVPRAVMAGLATAAGFVVVFGAVGGVVSAGMGAFMSATPYVGIAVGIVLMAIGVLTAAGRHLRVRLPGSGRSLGGKGRGLRAMVAFGISYGLASLGCALPVFLAGVTVAFTRGGLASGLTAFVAYALGMGAVLTALAVVVAVAPQAKLRSMRAAGERLHRPAGALLIVVGAYIVYYWVVGGLLNAQTGSGLIGAVDRITARLTTRMTPRLGVGLAALIVVAFVVAGVASRRRNSSGSTTTLRGPEPTAGSLVSANAPTPGIAPDPETSTSRRDRHHRLHRAWPFAAVGIVAALVETVVLSGVVTTGSASSTAASAQPVSPGIKQMLGLDWLSAATAATPAPFTLTDQHGQAVSLASFRGKAVILSFNDNHCQQLCPLYAGDLRAAVADLGPLARRVAFVGVNINPFYPQVASDVAFDRAHGLANLGEWHLLTGPVPALKTVWGHYGEQPLTGPDDSVSHDSSLWFINPQGKVRGDGVYGPGSADSTRWGYTLATMAERLLGIHTRLTARTSLNSAPTTPPSEAAAFTLPAAGTSARRPVSLASLRGRAVVINFFASWCTACQAEAADVEAAARRYAGKVSFVGVDVNDTLPSVQGYIDRHQLSYPIGLDTTGATAAAYGVTGLPTTVFVSPKGTIVSRHIGSIGTTALNHELDQIQSAP